MFADVRTLNNLADRARTTASSGIVTPRGMSNGSMTACPDAGCANTEGGRDLSVVWSLVSLMSPELVKIGQVNLSVTIGWQRTTIKRVVSSILAAEGYGVSEGSKQCRGSDIF